MEAQTLPDASGFYPPEKDFSMLLLEKLYGSTWTESIGNGTDLHTSTLFTMFSTFNTVVLSAVAFIVLYAAVMGVLGAGTTGTPFGKKMSLFWTPLRLSTAIGLLAPMPAAGGLAVIQVIVLSAVLASVNLANQLNSHLYAFLVSENSESQLQAEFISNQITGLSAENFRDNLTYAAIYTGALKGYIDTYIDKNPNAAESMGLKKSFDYLQTEVKEEKGMLTQRVHYVPFKAESATSWFNPFSGEDKEIRIATLEYTCPIADDSTPNFPQTCADMSSILLGNGISQNLFSQGFQLGVALAENDTENMVIKEINIAENAARIDEIILKVAEEFRLYYLTSDDFGKNQEFGRLAEKAGWMMAGTFYMTNGKIMRDIERKFSLNSSLTEYSFAKVAESLKMKSESLTDDLIRLETNAQNSSLKPDSFSMRAIINDSTNAMISEHSGDSALTKKVGEFTYYLTSNLNPIEHFGNGEDPIRALQTAGRIYLTSAITGWVTYQALSKTFDGWGSNSKKEGGEDASSKSIVGKIADVAMAPVNIVINGIGAYLKLIMVAAVVLLGVAFTAGLIYTFYIPLIPTLMWLSAVVGWVIFTIEAMIAAPLWAAAHAAPEGEGIAGQHAKRGYFLILQILMRPSLLLLALFTAYALLKVIGVIVSALLVPAITVGSMAGASETQDSGFLMQTAGTFSDIILMPFYVASGIVIITVVTVMYLHRIFSATFDIADRAFLWAGGEAYSDGARGDFDAMRGAVAGAAVSSASMQAVSQIKAGSALAGKLKAASQNGSFSTGDAGPGEEKSKEEGASASENKSASASKNKAAVKAGAKDAARTFATTKSPYAAAAAGVAGAVKEKAKN